MLEQTNTVPLATGDCPPGPRRRPLALVLKESVPQCDVSVVFPCPDEAGSVGLCVLDARVRLNAAGINGEVVVCDNCSQDESAEVAAEAVARVVNESRPGYGRSLAAGIVAATDKYIIMADADGSYDLDAVEP